MKQLQVAKLLLLPLAFLLIFFYFGCKSEAAKAVEEACKDGNITSDERSKIAKLLGEGSDYRKYREDEEIDKFIAQHCSIPPIGDTTVNNKPVYKVFIENSASMDGYVQGNSDFKNAIYGFLSDIKNKGYGITDEMNLFYINSETIPFKDDVAKFIKTMNVSTFKQTPGDKGTSDIADIVKRVLENTKGDTISIFISDCVFSPGKGKDGKNYLAVASIGIKSDFSDKIFAEKDLMTAVIKMSSQFSGTYYNYLNQAQKLDNKRPYYVWVIGKEKHLSNLLKKIDVKALSGVQTHHFFYPLSMSAQPKYRVLYSDKIGTFDIDHKDLNKINSARVSDRGTQNGEFGFAIGIDMSKVGIENTYVEQKDNYKINNSGYNIEIIPITEDMKVTTPELQNFTHKIIVKASALKSGLLNIELKRTIPQWVTDTDSKEDTNQKGEELNKTFGFGSLFKGVSDAYRPTGDDEFFKISINIQK